MSLIGDAELWTDPQPAAGGAQRTLRVAYTPDSDDAFNFYAWEHGRVALRNNYAKPAFERDHIIALNRAAQEGVHDVTSVSSAIYPSLAQNYYVLAVGTSVGRGYGPVLAAKGRGLTLDDLRGRRIAVGGLPTTGAALAAMYCQGAELVEMRYDLIADAVARGEFDAGVMIHEELLFFPAKGLTKVADLGATWCDETGLPLPVGLNLVHRRHGRDFAVDVARVCRRSLLWAMEHFDEAFAFASRFGRGCAQRHVEMFSNADTLCMPPDVRRAMRVIFDRVAALGIAPALREIEVIDACC
jgi:1,4-dihydroxy-6-naphthoate synthase